MERNEDMNKVDSSSDTVIAQSSSEEEKLPGNTSNDYVVVRDSSSSLDTLTSGSGGVTVFSSSVNTDDRKKGKFGTLKNSFRESGIFKIKKKSRVNENNACVEIDLEHRAKEVLQQQLQQYEKKQKFASDAIDQAASLKVRKKKSHSLVRKLNLNKFRSSPEQEIRRISKGDDSKSQSQFLQTSPVYSHILSRPATRKLEDDILENKQTKVEESEKISKTIELPSLTITSFPKISQKDNQEYVKKKERDNIDTQCSSTQFPLYTLSKWSESNETKFTEDTIRKDKSKGKFHSDSLVTSKSSPVEIRRKLSLLEEKQAIIQRQFDCREERKSNIQQMHNRNSDTLSNSENAFNENVGFYHVGSIEEDFTESCNRKDSKYSNFHAAIAPVVAVVDHLAKSSSSNTSNIGIDEKREHLYKILVIGELGAGKTSIIKRYVHQFFSQHYRATIGVDFALKVLNWDPHTIIRLQLWDIAGQERFGNMTRVYYKEAVGAFIVFDVTRSATLDAVVKWKQDLDSKVQLPDGSPIPCVLLANKCDQQKEGLINSSSKMDEYCKEKNFSGWFETSAKENINIEEAARFLVNRILQNDQIMRGNNSQDQTDGERFTLNKSPTSSKKFCTC